MKKAVLALWIFVAYLFITCDTRADELEIDQGAIYEFCLRADFINVRYCVEYLELCRWDGEKMQWCESDYFSDMEWRKL